MLEIDENSFITLTDENGNDVDFLVLDALTLDGEDYLVLTPLADEDEEENDFLFFLHSESTQEGEVYTAVEDASLLDTLSAVFKAQLEKEFMGNDALKPDDETE